MKLLEAQLVDSFSAIENAVIKYVIRSGSDGKEATMTMAQALQQAVIDFGELLEEIRDKEEAVPGLEEIHDRRVKALNHVISLLEEYCELLYRYATDYQEGTADPERELQLKGGELALSLRFEIKQNAKEKYLPECLEQVGIFDLLDQANKESGSRYLLGRHTTLSYVRYKPVYDLDDVAIVSQGPIDYKDDFTLETLYLYRRLYPNVMIVVSSWQGEVTDEFRWRAGSIGVEILENRKPDHKGVYNLFMQITSTREGIKHVARDPRVRYVLKTRNDQRYNHPEFLNYLKNLIRQYPAGGKLADSRLIYTGYSASMFSFPFRLTDFMLFGTTEMQLEYWGEDLDALRDFDMEDVERFAFIKMCREETDNRNRVLQMNKERRKEYGGDFGGDPEIMLAGRFYEKHYLKRMFTAEDDQLLHYWNWLRDYVVIADEKSMLWIWDKYEYRYMDKNSNESEGDLNHFTWLDLYLNGINGKKAELSEKGDNA